MKFREQIILGATGALGLSAVLVWLVVLHPRTDPPPRVLSLELPAADADRSAAGSAFPEREPASSRPAIPSQTASTSQLGNGFLLAPTTPEELRAFVARLRALPEAELLRLSNAEFAFEDSPLVEMLRRLDADWVVPELGKLAVGETQLLVKSVLVAGLCKGAGRQRAGDPRMLEVIRELLPQLSAAEMDPYRAAKYVVYSSFSSCLLQKSSYADLLLPHLQGSDNPDILIQGHLLLGRSGGADEVLARVMTDHADPQARFGALEGMRAAAMKGRIPPDQVTRLGLAALTTEHSERNRLLLVEMIGSTGGEEGLRALQGMVERGEPGLTGSAASMIAVKMEPEQAQETLEKALASEGLSPADRGAVYQALGAVPGERSGELLIGAMKNERLPDEERLQALRGLWNRPEDEDVRRDLADLVQSDAPGAMRAESLRMLAFGGTGSAAIDARKIAVEDDDPAVRSEAVMLSVLEPTKDSHGWLEERLLNDRSADVKAAALGAMVVQAHYTGDESGVRDHLARARRITKDPELLALIERGEKMVADGDRRRLDLELRGQAELYGELAPMTSGPARRAMERHAEYYKRMVDALSALASTD